MIDFIEEEEWYSVCCTAPPLYDIDTDYDEPFGEEEEEYYDEE